MKVDFTPVIKNLYGKDMTEKDPHFDPAEGQTMNDAPDISFTYKSAAANALLSEPVDPKVPAKPLDVLAKFELARKIIESTGPIQITKEEATLIERCTSKVYSVIIAGQMSLLLK